MNAFAKVTAMMIAAAALMFAQGQQKKEAPSATITGYVRDSGCVHRFHEVVKPLPNGCVEACVRGGSPLVILTKDEQVYHPISTDMPDVDVRQKLLPFVGKTGEDYRSGLWPGRIERHLVRTDRRSSRVSQVARVRITSARKSS